MYGVFQLPFRKSDDDQSVQFAQPVVAPNLASKHLVRVAYIGASVCAQGYLDLAVAQSNGALARVVNAGLAGDDFSEAIARFDTAVTPYKPDEVWLSMDPYINEATTTLDDAKKVSVATLINKVIEIGARPVVFGCNLKGSIELQVSVFNNWVKGYCGSRMIEFAELWDNLLVQATGALDSSKMDGLVTHPLWSERVIAGGQYASMRFPAQSFGYRRGVSYLRTNGVAGQNTQVVDPFNTTGTASKAGRWQDGTLNNGTITYSKVATTLPDIGVWQRSTIALAAVSGAYTGNSVNAPGMAHTEGEEWYASFRLKMSNMVNLSVDVYIDWQNSGGASLAGRKSFIPAVIGDMDGYISYILPAPANAWKAQLSFKHTQITNGVAASGDIDVAMINISKYAP